MQYRVEIYKKIGNMGYSSEDESKVVLRNSDTSIKMNRDRDTPVGEATIVAQFEHLPLAEYKGGSKGIIDNFARIEVYFDEDVEFCGVIKKYEYDEVEKVIELTCHDMMYRLLNLTFESIDYTDTTAVNIIEDLVIRAGLSFYRSGGTDYSIPKLHIEEGTAYMDIIQSLIETMHANIRCAKNGTVYLEEQYPDYVEGGGDINHFDWTYVDSKNVATDNAGRDASEMKNILKITCQVKNGDKIQTVFDKFEDPSMTEYLNGEKWYDITENALANTQEKRKAVAGWKFLEYWRKSTPLTILPTKGNKDIELGQVVKLIRDNTDPGYYLVVGIDSEITGDDGYTDTLQLQGMRDKRTIYEIPKLLASGIMKEAS